MPRAERRETIHCGRFLDTRRRGGALALALASLVLAGCGGERTFTAEEMVAELNSSGAQLELGEPLTSTQEGVEVLALELTSPGSATEAGDVHGGGSLTVTEDAESARVEYAQCEGAVTLLCYRAANVLIILEDDLTPEDTSRVEGALRALEG